jgi:hypothetical protein
MTTYKLSPSDLTFAWDECRHCFYMKVKHGIAPKTPFPGIFSRIAALTSGFYQGRSARELDPRLPEGVIAYREQFVRSVPLAVPGAVSDCYILGRFDAVIAFSDGTFGVVDYKTSEPKDEHAAFYSRQLTAYALALENPAPRALALSPVSRLGLFIVTPQRFERGGGDEMIFANGTLWVDVPRDDAAFLAFLGEVLAVLDLPQPPEPTETCGICQYRQQMADFHP